MSKRTQLWIALGALGVVIALLSVLFVAVIGRGGGDDMTENVEQPGIWQSGQQGPPADPWAGREEMAQAMVWDRRARALAENGQRTNIRQAVETELLRQAFPNLHWERLERVGWRAFQQEGSVYEVQFLYRDVGVEFGPAWIVQTDAAGLQPPGSGGVVAANVYAEVIENGVADNLERFLNREAEVVQALTDHRFEGNARLASAILVFFKSRRRVDTEHVAGWTVIGERIIPEELTLYRAFFQWEEDGRDLFAHWEVNLDTQSFRGLNLLASEIMAAGDTIDAGELESIRPRMIDEADPPASQRRLFDALRTIVDNERLLEAVSSLLWHRSVHGTNIEYSRWNARRAADTEATFEVVYEYLENDEARQITWLVDVQNDRITPTDDLARLAQVALSYNGAGPTDE